MQREGRRFEDGPVSKVGLFTPLDCESGGKRDVGNKQGRHFSTGISRHDGQVLTEKLAGRHLVDGRAVSER